MLALFGWMDLLIILKWLVPKDITTNYPPLSAERNATQYSPPIITTMIDIFLSGASNLDSNPPFEKKYDYLFDG